MPPARFQRIPKSFTIIPSATMSQYRKSPRARFLDYDHGDFFITICTHNKKHYFGEISDGEMCLSEVGRFVHKQLEMASQFNKDIEVLLFVVMPNHLHAIISCCPAPFGDESPAEMQGRINGSINQRLPNPAMRANSTCQRHVPTVSRYVNSLKGAVTKFARRNNIEFCWQSRYHDHCIRSNCDGSYISEYVRNNIANWQHDGFFN